MFAVIQIDGLEEAGMAIEDRVELYEDNAGGLFVARGDVVIEVSGESTDEVTFATAAAAWGAWVPGAIQEFPGDVYQRAELKDAYLIATYADGVVELAAGAHPDSNAKRYLGYDFVARQEGWTPTHRITFTSDRAPQTWIVMLVEDGGEGTGGPGYEAVDWVTEAPASWSFDPDGRHGAGWYCEGQATPGGANGEVEVEHLAGAP